MRSMIIDCGKSDGLRLLSPYQSLLPNNGWAVLSQSRHSGNSRPVFALSPSETR